MKPQPKTPQNHRVNPQTNRPASPQPDSARYGSHVRVWLLVFLVLTVLFVAGSLLARQKLDTLRDAILAAAEDKTGTQLDVESVSLSGISGLRLEEPSVELRSGDDILLRMKVPVAYVQVDLVDLLRGSVTIDHIRLDRATVQVEGSLETLRRFLERRNTRPPSSRSGRVHVLGKSCQLVLTNPRDGSRTTFEDIDFDVLRSLSSQGLQARIEGNLEAFQEKTIRCDIGFVSPRDFQVQVQVEHISAADIERLVPQSRETVEAGTLTARVGVSAYGDPTVHVDVESSVEGLSLRDQPAFLEPFPVRIDAKGTFDRESRILTMQSVQARSEGLETHVEGTIRFDGPEPSLDLQVEAGGIPAQEFLDSRNESHKVDLMGALGGLERKLANMEEKLGEYGDLTLKLPVLDEVAVQASGNWKKPTLVVQASARSGEIDFVSKTRKYPSGRLTLDEMEFSWDSESNKPSGTFAIVDGSIQHQETGIRLDAVQGRLELGNGLATLRPFTAEFTGSRFSGSCTYDFNKKEGTARLDGTIKSLEDTVFADVFRNTELAGDTTLSLSATKSGGTYHLDGDLGANQTEVRYRWWFRKPSGLGARAHFACEMVPRKSLVIETDISAAGTQGHAQTRMARDGAKWRLQKTVATFDSLDIVTSAKCLQLPYEITGGSVTDATYEWVRDEGLAADGSLSWHSEGVWNIDNITLLPEGSSVPIRCKDVRIRSELVNGSENTALFLIDAGQGWLPALGETWFLNPEIDPEVREKYPPQQRSYTYELSCNTLEMPPWKGSSFMGRAFFNEAETGLTSYAATIENGRLEGSYRKNRSENAYTATADWRDIPAHYLIEHLDLPQVLRGTTTGHVEYAMDYDDPDTLEGAGWFEIADGQFSADFLLYELGQQLDGDMSALPPSLKFSKVSSDIEFEKDLVRTPKLTLTSEGLAIEATGHFVKQGEMDYDMKVSLTPETAAKIPALAEQLNLDGYRIAKQNVDLAFKITGPTYSPRGELSQAPSVHVTIVTGGLKVVSDVIDMPRKILVDLLKIGGGIVGVKKNTP